MPVGEGQFHVTRNLRDPRFHKNQFNVMRDWYPPHPALPLHYITFVYVLILDF